LVNDHAAAEQNGAFLEFADRGFLIEGGRARLSGSRAELIESDAVKSAYFGLGWIGSPFHGIDDPVQPIVSTQSRTENRFPLFLELPKQRFRGRFSSAAFQLRLHRL
jgi:hypothetical protein